jgi:hypothetical protein
MIEISENFTLGLADAPLGFYDYCNEELRESIDQLSPEFRAANSLKHRTTNNQEQQPIQTTPKKAAPPSPEMRSVSARPSGEAKESAKKNKMHEKKKKERSRTRSPPIAPTRERSTDQNEKREKQKKKNRSRSRSPPISQTRGRSAEPKGQSTAESSRRNDNNNRQPTSRATSQNNARSGKTKKTARNPKNESPPPSDASSYSYEEDDKTISPEKERSAREPSSTRTRKVKKSSQPLKFQHRAERELGITLAKVSPICPLGHAFEFTKLVQIDKDLQRELEPKCYCCSRHFAIDSALATCHRCTPLRISCVKCASFAEDED